MARVLYLSYNGMLEPLGQSQIYPYLRELAAVHGHRFWVVSYEKPRDWAAARRQAAAACGAGGAGLAWTPLRYHQRPTAPATLYDLLRGLPPALRLARRQRIEIVHVRGYVPMPIGIALKRLCGADLIFDMRGFWADERADTGQCARESRQYRAIKALERASLRAADQIVILTERALPALRGQSGAPIAVIPCCVDLRRFRRDQALRAALRARRGWENKLVLAVCGSLGGRYATDELAELYAIWRAAARESGAPDPHLLVITPSDPALIAGPLARRGIDPADYTVAALPPAEVAGWLSAADAAVMLIKPWYSTIAMSPTKQAEYLACGLPIVANAGVGDSDGQIRADRVGVILDDWTPAAYRAAWDGLAALRAEAGLAERCRESAERRFALELGVERFAAIYRALEGRP